jgi:hypothetical protein
VSQLQTEEKVGIIAPSTTVSFSAITNEPCQGREMAWIGEQLPGIRTPFGNHSSRFTPNEFGSALAESLVPAKRQRPWRAVWIPIATFHRLDTKAIADPPSADIDGSKQRLPIVTQSNVDSEP